MDEKTALTYAITRALAYKENGGKPNLDNLKAGKTGESKSIFQFTPDTWKKDAKEVLGDENAQLTPDNETKVVTSKVSNWIDKGYNVKQIASMWNAGVGEPNAHSGKFSDGSPSVGTNKKYDVKFDVPKYANDVATYAKKFYADDLSKKITPTQTNQSTQNTVAQQQTAPTLQPQPVGSMGKISGMMNPSMASG